MSKNASTLEREQAYREAFLARLSQKLAAPTSEWTTVRCWTEPALNRVSKQVREELLAEGMESSLTHRSLLEWVGRLGLAHSLPVEGASFYLLEIGASAD